MSRPLSPSKGDELRARVVAVVGPKGAGKSTFAKELFERCVRAHGGKVAFLDTDLGRPEYTLPGMVSLSVADSALGEEGKKSDAETLISGGPFKEVATRVLGAVFLGEDDPSQRPEDYLNAIRQLGQLVHSKEFEYVIINTHGWFSGLGQDVLEAILLSTGVSDVVQIVPEQKMATLGSLLRASDTFQIHTLAPAKESRPRESKLSRDRRIVDHFVADTCMYCVGLSKVKIRYPLGLIDRNLPPPYALLALNASMVGLSITDSNDPLHFLGIGLVCSIDLRKQCLFVLTRLTSEQLAKCEVLTMGTSAHVPLHLMPSRFHPGKEESGEDIDLDILDDEDHFVPYLTSCKMIGYGSVAQQRGQLKRRRLDGGRAGGGE